MSEPESEQVPPAKRRSAATHISKLPGRIEGDDVSLGVLLQGLGSAGLGLMLIVLALPAFLPTPGLPAGFVFGTALALVALQMMRGSHRPDLPAWLKNRTIPRWLVVSISERAAPVLHRIEQWLSPRHKMLTNRVAHTLLAFPVLILGVMILLPIPFGNQLPAIAIIALALGLIARDGLAIVAGLALSLIAIAWNTAILVFGVEIARAVGLPI